MRPNRSLLNGLGQLEANMKANEAEAKKLAVAAEPGAIRKDAGEVKTINLEPHWPGMVRYLHANPDLKWWKKALMKDDNGWFAAVAATHPDKAVAQLGRASKSFKGTEGYAGIKEHLESLEAGLAAGIDDNEDDRQAYQSAVRKRQAKLKPHTVCPSCKAPKKPNEACQKCGNDPELGDYLGTFLGEANPAAQRMLAILERAGVKPVVQRVIGRLRQPVKVKAAEEGEEGYDADADATFVMVNIDVEVRPVTAEQVEEWESMKNGTSLMPSQLDQLEKALQSGDIHFVEAMTSDNQGNLG